MERLKFLTSQKSVVSRDGEYKSKIVDTGNLFKGMAVGV